ncbi:MAG: integration host factor subunit beta [Cytophagales bacterium]|nr:integration host factor subunit beta [Cytophagales bacterium]
MIKNEVIREVAKQTGLGREDVRLSVDALIQVIKDTLAKRVDAQVSFRGFGVFRNRVRAEKTARNIKRNTRMVLPERVLPTFKPSKGWSRQVQEGHLL